MPVYKYRVHDISQRQPYPSEHGWKKPLGILAALGRICYDSEQMFAEVENSEEGAGKDGNET